VALALQLINFLVLRKSGKEVLLRRMSAVSPTHLSYPAANAARVQREGGEAGREAGQTDEILKKTTTTQFYSHGQNRMLHDFIRDFKKHCMNTYCRYYSKYSGAKQYPQPPLENNPLPSRHILILTIPFLP
jgi:hypothetical protein